MDPCGDKLCLDGQGGFATSERSSGLSPLKKPLLDATGLDNLGPIPNLFFLLRRFLQVEFGTRILSLNVAVVKRSAM